MLMIETIDMQRSEEVRRTLPYFCVTAGLTSMMICC